MWNAKQQLLVYGAMTLLVCWGIYGVLNGHELINIWFEGHLYVGEGPEVDVDIRTWMAYLVQTMPTISTTLMLIFTPSLSWRRDGYRTFFRWPKKNGLKWFIGPVAMALVYNLVDWYIGNGLGLAMRRWNVIKPKTVTTIQSLPAIMFVEGGLAFFLIPLFAMRFRLNPAKSGAALGLCSFLYSLPAFLGTAYLEGGTEVLAGMTWLLLLFMRTILRGMNVGWVFAGSRGSMGFALWYLTWELFFEGALMRITHATIDARIIGQAIHVGVAIVQLLLITYFSPPQLVSIPAPPPPWMQEGSAGKVAQAKQKKTQ